MVLHRQDVPEEEEEEEKKHSSGTQDKQQDVADSAI